MPDWPFTWLHCHAMQDGIRARYENGVLMLDGEHPCSLAYAAVLSRVILSALRAGHQPRYHSQRAATAVQIWHSLAAFPTHLPRHFLLAVPKKEQAKEETKRITIG